MPKNFYYLVTRDSKKRQLLQKMQEFSFNYFANFTLHKQQEKKIMQYSTHKKVPNLLRFNCCWKNFVKNFEFRK